MEAGGGVAEARYLELASRPGMEALKPLPEAERLGTLVRVAGSIEISREADSWNCWLKAGEYGGGPTPEAALTEALLAATEVKT